MKKNNQVPEQIQGQLTVEEVLSPTESGTQANNTHVADPVREPIASQQGANGCASDDNQPCEQVPNNVTPITHARAKRTKQKSASQVQNGQSVQIDQTGLKSPENALKCDADNQVRKTGRKPGTKDVVPRKKRTDFNISDQIPADEKQQIVRYNVELFSLGKLKDPNDEEEVRERLVTYFSISEKYQQVPTVAGLALALGIDRRTLWTWMEQKVGTIKNPVVMDTLKHVYNMIASQYEGMLTQGKIVPVAGFFLMQNNFGYKNQTDHVVVAAGDPEPDTADIAARAGLLEEGER